MSKAAIAALVVLALTPSCQSGRRAAPAGCGLPTPAPGLEARVVPEPFLLDGQAEPTLVERRPGGFSAALNVPLSVSEALEAYRGALAQTGRQVVGEDNEGFEAELFVRRKDELGMIQVRRSVCDHASVVFLNFVTYPVHERTSTPVPSPA